MYSGKQKWLNKNSIHGKCSFHVELCQQYNNSITNAIAVCAVMLPLQYVPPLHEYPFCNNLTKNRPDWSVQEYSCSKARSVLFCTVGGNVRRAMVRHRFSRTYTWKTFRAGFFFWKSWWLFWNYFRNFLDYSWAGWGVPPMLHFITVCSEINVKWPCIYIMHKVFIL